MLLNKKYNINNFSPTKNIVLVVRYTIYLILSTYYVKSTNVPFVFLYNKILGFLKRFNY